MSDREESMAAGHRRGGGEGDGVRLPRPTAAPMLFALGLALLLGGLVTHVIVSAVGFALAVSGAVGWWREVLPVERHELVPLQAPAERPPPVEPRTRGVEPLRAGEEGHRLRLPVRRRPYSSGLRGGLAGGASMAAVAVVYGLIARGSPWYPINLLGSVAIPSLNVADAAQLSAFNGLGLLAATIMHAGLSLLVGLVYAALLPTLPGRVLLWGGIVAPLVWSGVARASLDVVSPALKEHVNWIWFVASQVAFGLTAGLVISRTEEIRTLQAWPLATRAGIESSGAGRDPEPDA
jgi:hypothetical protein